MGLAVPVRRRSMACRWVPAWIMVRYEPTNGLSTANTLKIVVWRVASAQLCFKILHRLFLSEAGGPFNTHSQCIGSGLVQSIFSSPSRRSAFTRAAKGVAPRRRAKNALHYTGSRPRLPGRTVIPDILHASLRALMDLM